MTIDEEIQIPTRVGVLNRVGRGCGTRPTVGQHDQTDQLGLALEAQNSECNTRNKHLNERLGRGSSIGVKKNGLHECIGG